MDYGELLYKAHENNKNAVHKEVRCYKTEFSPPKKLERKVSSVNIKKFLARKEEEEKKKMEEAKKKKEELLALRSQDKKAQKRVQTMLRSTKSANKSVMEDAVDNVNTADTLNGFFGDTDDYGYVSQESAAFYSKLLNKYENMPPEPPKFEPAKKEVKDLKAAKDRVKAALQREAEEELLPHKRKKKKHDSKENDEEQNNMKLNSQDDDIKVKEKESSHDNKKEGKPKSKKPMPPPMNFDQLLQIAQKKQFEPIMIDESLLKKEPERLLTKKQKLEAEREAQCRRAKLLGQKVPDSSKKSDDALKKTESGQKVDSQSKSSKLALKTEKLEKKKNDGSSKPSSELPLKLDKKECLTKGSLNGSKQSNKTGSLPTSTKGSLPVKQVPKFDRSGSVEQKSVRPEPNSQKPSKTKKVDSLEREIQLMRERQEFLTRKLKEKEMAMKKMEEERKKEREKQIVKPREMEKKPVKKPVLEKKKLVPVPKKRQIISDSEEEYDSELEDFIDDGPEEGNDYSKYISEIFGYDKSKYSKVDDDDDDECMESNFAQISKEEYVSTKIGIMEDLEDIRKEQEEKRRLKEKKLKKLAESRKKMRCK